MAAFRTVPSAGSVRNESTDSSEGGIIRFNITPVSESISNAQATASNSVRLLSLHHVGVHVTDLETSISFYESVFSLTVAERLSLGRERIVFLAAGAQLVELIVDGSGRRQTGVVDHLAFAVDNLDDWLLNLRAHGVQVLDPQVIHIPQIGARILFCLGPDDERIELLEQRHHAGNPVTIAAWRAAVKDDSGEVFAELVRDDVVLEGSVFAKPIAGREGVRNAIRQSSRLYDRLEFSYESQSADRTYFEWQGSALGLPVWGVTAITLEEDHRISRVVLSHRPLDIVNRFSAALAKRLEQR